MTEPSATNNGDLAAIESLIMNIIDRVQGHASSGHLLANGVNDLYVNLTYGTIGIELELSHE